MAEPAFPEGQPVPSTVAARRPDAGLDVPSTFMAMPPPMAPPGAASSPQPPTTEPAPAARDGGVAAPPGASQPASPPATDAGIPVVRMDARPAQSPPPRPAPGSWWRPAVGMTWDWQLKTPIEPGYSVDVYDIDLFENEPEVIADLRARGRRVICYVNLGAWEDWRPDANRFPKHIIGAAYHGFPDEAWLDIRPASYAALLPIIRSRLDMAVSKGCDAIEPDNLNGYDTSTHEPSGFPLTSLDQLLYNRLVAGEAHLRGLAVGLKNDLNQVKDLVAEFDFAVNEQCFEYGECEHLLPFIAAGKPVFQAEYGLPLAQFCNQARANRFSSIKKTETLDATRETCP